jgi:AcrR family transcriptional regulator
MKIVVEKKKRSIDPDAKRVAILAAASELFSKHGFEATSIAAIAAKADVAVGTVHRIFSDKANVLVASQIALEERMTNVMIEAWRRPGQLHDRFSAMLNALFDEMIIVQPFMPIMALKAESLGKPNEGLIIKRAILDFVVLAIDQGVFRKMPPVEAAAIAFGMVDGAMRQAAQGDLRVARKIYVPLLADMMMRALSPD